MIKYFTLSVFIILTFTCCDKNEILQEETVPQAMAEILVTSTLCDVSEDPMCNQGTPVMANVYLFKSEEDREFNEVTVAGATDGMGQKLFSNLEPGVYYLTLEHDGQNIFDTINAPANSRSFVYAIFQN